MNIIYLPIEITARELDSRIMLAHELAKHDWIVYLGNKQEVNYLAYKIGFGHYLYKDHSPLALSHLRKVKKGKNNIYCMDEEGFIYHSDNEYRKRVSNDVLRLCSKYFLWGEQQQATLRNIGLDQSDKEVITGNPRFDILTKLNRHILNLPVLDKGYILINSMFAAGNWNSETYGTQNYVDHQKSRGKIQNKADLDFYAGKQNYSEEMIGCYQSMILTLRAKFPQLEIFIRPHPDENHQTWYQFADEHGFKLATEGSAVEWIQNAMCTISTGCTTTIESFALDVPVINYAPFGTSKYAAMLPSNFATACKTQCDVVQKVEELLKLKNQELVPDCKVTSYIYNFYTGDAAIKIANEIRKCNLPEGKKFLAARIYFYEKKLQLLSLIRKLRYHNRPSNQKFQSLNATQVLTKLMKMGNGEKFNVKLLTENTINISRVS